MPQARNTRESVASHVIRTSPEAVTKQNGEIIDNETLLELDVDLLSPCAVGNVITAENVDSIRANIVVEGANGPTAFEADSRLAARDVPVIPDVLANAGGVTVSYFEWLQGINCRSWCLKRVNSELEDEMQQAWTAVRGAYEDDDLMDPRTVAEAGYSSLMNDRRIVVPGFENKLKVFARRLTPRRLFVKTAKRVQVGE